MIKNMPALALADSAPDYDIDTDKARLDLVFIHGFLSRSHWARGIPFDVMQKAIENSMAFGLYRDGRQVGFARVVSDYATFAYLADVFVVEAERRRVPFTTLCQSFGVSPRVGYKWLERYRESGWKDPRVQYHLFFPHALSGLRPLEPHLSRIPFGGQYSVTAIKPS